MIPYSRIASRRSPKQFGSSSASPLSSCEIGAAADEARDDRLSDAVLGGEEEHALNELLAPRHPGPPAVVAKDAERFLLQFLHGAPRSRAEVMEAAGCAGLNEKAVERAAKALEVGRDPAGRERVWKVPGVPAGGAL